MFNATEGRFFGGKNHQALVEERRWKTIYKWAAIALSILFVLCLMYSALVTKALIAEFDQSVIVQAQNESLSAQLQDALAEGERLQSEFNGLQLKLGRTRLSKVEFLDVNLYPRFQVENWESGGGGEYWVAESNPLLTDTLTNRRISLDVFKNETIFLRVEGYTLRYDTCMSDAPVSRTSCRVVGGFVTDLDPRVFIYDR